MKYFFYSFEEMEDQEGILEKYIETMKEGKGDPNTIYKVIILFSYLSIYF